MTTKLKYPPAIASLKTCHAMQTEYYKQKCALREKITCQSEEFVSICSKIHAEIQKRFTKNIGNNLPTEEINVSCTLCDELSIENKELFWKLVKEFFSSKGIYNFSYVETGRTYNVKISFNLNPR